MDLSKFFNIFRRYLWLFILVASLAGLTTYLTLSNQVTLYEAKTRLLIGPSLDSPSPDLNSLKIGGQLIQTYAELLSSRPFLEAINNKLEKKVDLQVLAGMIEPRQNADTRILTIVVRDHDPKQAVAIANAAATTLVEQSPSKDNTTALLRNQMSNHAQQLEQIVSDSEASIEELEAKLIALGNVSLPSSEAAQENLQQQNLVISQLAEERARLSDSLKTLATIYTVMRDTNINQVQIFEPAGTVLPVNQNLPLRAAAAGLAGLILSMAIIFSTEYYADTIRFPGDFRRAAKAPLLSAIGKHNRLDGTVLERVITFARPESLAANNYRMAAAKLLSSMGKSLPYTLLSSSVGSQSGEDTAEAVVNLGVAFAQAGKRVVLVDAQFHNPYLTELFGATDMPGLADFVPTNKPKMKLLQVKGFTGIQLLPVGLSPEKNSSAVFNSTTIAGLVEELHEVDIVLFAGPPISWSAESLTLATEVNGVILVARPGEASAKTVNEVAETLRTMNVNLVGIIFDYNRPRSGFKSKARNTFESARVAQEDSHV